MKQRYGIKESIDDSDVVLPEIKAKKVKRKNVELDGLERAKIIERLIKERGYKCERCKSQLSPKQNHPRQRQIHHKIKLTEGGDYSDENLELLCLTCHRIEHGTMPKN